MGAALRRAPQAAGVVRDARVSRRRGSVQDHGGDAPKHGSNDRCERQVLPERRVVIGLLDVDFQSAQPRFDTPALDHPVVVVPASQRDPPDWDCRRIARRLPPARQTEIFEKLLRAPDSPASAAVFRDGAPSRKHSRHNRSSA